jgi:hypothetical protein
MRDLVAVSWLSPSRRTLLSIGAVVLVVFSLCAILKVNSGGRDAPAQELLTGSIPRAVAARKSPPNDPMVAFLRPEPLQNTAVDGRAVPLPRPRPKRP